MDSTTTGTETGQDAKRDAALSMTERFERFHADNPGVYQELVGRCREFARATRGRRFGLRQPWERMRWDLAIRTARPEGDPKLNDGYCAFYARLIEHQEQDLAGLFETRRAPEADAWAASIRADQPAGGGQR